MLDQRLRRALMEKTAQPNPALRFLQNVWSWASARPNPALRFWQNVWSWSSGDPLKAWVRGPSGRPVKQRPDQQYLTPILWKTPANIRRAISIGVPAGAAGAAGTAGTLLTLNAIRDKPSPGGSSTDRILATPTTSVSEPDGETGGGPATKSESGPPPKVELETDKGESGPSPRVELKAAPPPPEKDWAGQAWDWLQERGKDIGSWGTGAWDWVQKHPGEIAIGAGGALALYAILSILTKKRRRRDDEE